MISGYAQRSRWAGSAFGCPNQVHSECRAVALWQSLKDARRRPRRGGCDERPTIGAVGADRPPMPALRFLLATMLVAGALAGCGDSQSLMPSAPGVLVAAAPAYPAERFVGRWGLGSYHRDTDKVRTEKIARQQCGNAYVVKAGPNGGLMMYLADDPEMRELKVKGAAGGRTFIGREVLRRRMGSRSRVVRRQLTGYAMDRPGARRPLRDDGNGSLFLSGVLRMRALSYAVTFAVLAGLPFAAADAQSNFKPQSVEEIDAPEQPGYQPSPDEERLPTALEKQVVFFRSTEPPGTIVVQTEERFLYLVKAESRAIRYGIGVGREGFQWAGLSKIARKQEWPDWRPPPEMIERQPYLPRFMAGGPGNPLGARALYLGARSIASTAPTSRRRSAMPCPRAASASSIRRDRSLRQGAGRHQGGRPAGAETLSPVGACRWGSACVA